MPLFRALRAGGQPDRFVDEGGLPIPEERKSARRVYESYRAQMAVYFLLIEDETGVRPPHQFIVLGSRDRHRTGNTPELRAGVLDVAAKIRAARRQRAETIQVNQPPDKCRGAECASIAGS